MKKFEYLTIECVVFLDGGDLDRYGEKGWELIFVKQVSLETRTDYERFTYIFKREKP